MLWTGLCFLNQIIVQKVESKMVRAAFLSRIWIPFTNLTNQIKLSPLEMESILKFLKIFIFQNKQNKPSPSSQIVITYLHSYWILSLSMNKVSWQSQDTNKHSFCSQRFNPILRSIEQIDLLNRVIESRVQVQLQPLSVPVTRILSRPNNFTLLLT